jgi:hypothetical protein
MSKTSTKLEKIISTFEHANISIFKTNTSSKTQNKKLYEKNNFKNTMT